MASFLKGFDEYWRVTANTCQKLVAPCSKPKTVVIQYVARQLTGEKIESAELSAERTCILASDMQLPFEWAEAVVKLQAMNKPASITQSSWLNIQEACNQLFRDDFGLLKLVINHEWQVEDIFGCHPIIPLVRFDMMGLILLLHQGDEVIAVNKQRIKILKRSGSEVVLSKSLSPAREKVLLHELIN